MTAAGATAAQSAGAHVRLPQGQAAVVAALRDPAAFGGGCESVEVIETHISYVFLAGDAAYKIKKAIRLPFLDFSTLDARRRFCETELALNRRTAPSLYRDVVPIVARDASFAIGGDGPAVEWAVRMRRFPQRALLSSMLGRGEVDGALVDALAERVASFHDAVAGPHPEGEWGTPAQALRLALDNLAELEALVALVPGRARIEVLRTWTLQEHAARAALMRDRFEAGFVRECHGDLHLANVAMIDGAPTPFDCIDFDPALRWSDVASDVAFAAMDFRARGRADLSRRFVNRYLETTGDHAGAALLPFHVVYRALVRAKVALLRAGGANAHRDAERARTEALAYLDLATSASARRAPAIVVMHGLSGCGKTTLSQALVEALDCIRIRMDVERKRQHGLDALSRTGGGVDEGLYAPQASRAAYGRVADTAEALARAGQRVVVDAAFLRRWQRDRFREAAARAGAAFAILDMPASPSVLRERVARRSVEGRDASDANLAVLEHQLATQDLLSEDERGDVVAFDADVPIADTLRSSRWRDWLAAVDASGAGDSASSGGA